MDAAVVPTMDAAVDSNNADAAVSSTVDTAGIAGVTAAPVASKVRKFKRSISFPERSQWLRFIALSCKDLFNPYMPTRTGDYHFVRSTVLNNFPCRQ
jgi:hypothetical protein